MGLGFGKPESPLPLETAQSLDSSPVLSRVGSCRRIRSLNGKRDEKPGQYLYVSVLVD